jgi:predicted DNA-binding transcriptional regulator AlpA
MTEDRILSLSQAAEIVPLSKSSLYRVASAGTEDSPFHKRAGRWMTTESDLLAWVRNAPRPKPRKPAENPMPIRRSRSADRSRFREMVETRRQEQEGRPSGPGRNEAI